MSMISYMHADRKTHPMVACPCRNKLHAHGAGNEVRWRLRCAGATVVGLTRMRALALSTYNSYKPSAAAV